MNTVKLSDLTNEAAIEDALRIYSYFFDFCRELMGVLFCGETNIKETGFFCNYGFVSLDFKEIFIKAIVFDKLNNNKEKNKDIENIKNEIENSFKNDFLLSGVLLNNLKFLYSYAQGNIERGLSIDNHIVTSKKAISNLSLLFTGSILSFKKRNFFLSLNTINKYFPRVSHAIHITQLRNRIYLMLQDFIVDKYLLPQELADLAEVTYMAIKKQINTGKIPAEKIDNEWRIPLDFVLSWLEKKGKKIIYF